MYTETKRERERFKKKKKKTHTVVINPQVCVIIYMYRIPPDTIIVYIFRYENRMCIHI